MRQLLVMSPHAFLGYEFSPAVASQQQSTPSSPSPLCTLVILESTFAVILPRHYLQPNEGALQCKPCISKSADFFCLFMY